MALPQNILIDTNIIIQLEDNKKVSDTYSELARMCSEYGIKICIHSSSIDDINRDRDKLRRDISLSKLQKYPSIAKTAIPKADKEKRFGRISSDNDDVDTDLLISLLYDVADIIITEDKNIHARAKRAGLQDRVLKVGDAVTYFRRLLGSVPVNYVHVQDKTCNQFNPNDPFFDSLKSDYPPSEDADGFEVWFQKSCMAKKRLCWLIQQESRIGGLIIYKDEARPANGVELDFLGVPGNKVLKLCLFKIDGNALGEKFGEQLLKKAMDYAYRNNYDSLYLTVFPKHITLISLIESFGFKKANNKGGELVYYKYSKVPKRFDTIPALNFHQTYWPCVTIRDVTAYCIPIIPEFHRRLFPDASAVFDPPPPPQMDLFPEVDTRAKTPGNAIRKVYVSNSVTKEILPGSPLFFFSIGNRSFDICRCR